MLSQQKFPRVWQALREGVACAEKLNGLGSAANDGHRHCPLPLHQQGSVGCSVAPGAVLGFWQVAAAAAASSALESREQPGEAFQVAAVGARSVRPAVLPMTSETQFDLASLTKVLATAPLIGLARQRGWLAWHDPVQRFLPDFPHPQIKIFHLLSHTAGLPAHLPYWQQLVAGGGQALTFERRQALMRASVMTTTPLDGAAVGYRELYSDVSFLLLGWVVEAIFQKPLDQAAQEDLWGPMGITGLHFRRTTTSSSSSSSSVVGRRCQLLGGWQPADLWRGGGGSSSWIIAPTLEASLRGEWRRARRQPGAAEVDDDNAWFMGGVAGHAGVFGSVADVLAFARGWMQGGCVSPRVRQEMESPVSALFPEEFPPRRVALTRALGWDQPAPQGSLAGRYFSPQSIGHLGFTGVSLWMDPVVGSAVVLLTNWQHPSGGNPLALKHFRPTVHDALREDLGLV